MNNVNNKNYQHPNSDAWIHSFEQEMEQAVSMQDKWNVIASTYNILAGTSNHVKYEKEFRYLFSRMKALAKFDLYTAGYYLLHLARCGTVRELTENPMLLSVRSAVNNCMNELYSETKDNYLALIMGVAYYEASLPLPVGYAKGRDLAVKYFKASQEKLDSQPDHVQNIIRKFISNLKEYEDIQKFYVSFKWKGDQAGAKTYLKKIETFYEPLREDFLYSFILRELVSWYGYCEKFSMQYKTICSCIERYPGDESLPPMLMHSKKRRLSFGNILKNIPFILLCLLAVLIIPVIGAAFVIAFFDSVKVGIVAFFILLLIRIAMIKGGSGDGIDGSILDFMEGFFWGRM